MKTIYFRLAVVLTIVLLLFSCWSPKPIPIPIPIPECCQQSVSDVKEESDSLLRLFDYTGKDTPNRFVAYNWSNRGIERKVDLLNDTIVSLERCPCGSLLAIEVNVDIQIQGGEKGQGSRGGIGGDSVITLPIDIGEKTNGIIKSWNLEDEIEVGNRQLSVAIIDTGLDSLYLKKINALIGHKLNLINQSKEPIDDNGHGTLVTSIIAQNSKSPNTSNRYLIYKAFDENGVGRVFQIGCALLCAIKYKADVINASFGLYDDHPILNEIIQEVRDHKIPIVAAQGNHCLDEDYFPASYSSVLGVAALHDNIGKLNMRGEWLDFSYKISLKKKMERWDCSNWTKGTDFSGPGSIVIDGSRTKISGTSYTAAWVTGLALRYAYAIPNGPIPISPKYGEWTGGSTSFVVKTRGQNTTSFEAPK